MSAVDDFESDLAAARTALLAADFATARLRVGAAAISMLGIPNINTDGIGANYRDQLAGVRAAIDDLEGRSGSVNGKRKIQTALVTNQAVSAGD